MYEESITTEENLGKMFWGRFWKFFKMNVMYQELIMNEQNLFKKFEENLGN